MALVIAFTLPDWPPGFTAHAVHQLINAAADAMGPWYTVDPLPPIYRAGVVYRPEPNHGSGYEDFADPWTAYRRGWVDCDDATLWRVLELRARGESAAATRAEWTGPDVHALVRRGNGKLEDPSLILLKLERLRG
jgi:hypothetical protein